MGQVNSKSDASASHSSKTKVANASLAYKWRKSSSSRLFVPPSRGWLPLPPAITFHSTRKNERSSANEVPSPSEGFTNGLVSGWYSSNIAVLVLNKYLLSNNDFKYSIFLTHVMNACLLFSYVSITWLKILLVSPQGT
ncbi:putative sugar phosphate/phosphate translocator [Glycine soja]